MIQPPQIFELGLSLVIGGFGGLAILVIRECGLMVWDIDKEALYRKHRVVIEVLARTVDVGVAVMIAAVLLTVQSLLH